MQLQSRSYNPGPVFRPKPFVLNREENSLVAIVTSWTTMNEAERIAQLIVEQVEQTSGGDDEATRVGDKAKTPGDFKNDLHRALAATSQIIYKQDNLKQARLLVEALVIQIQGQSIVWAQVGQPNLYLLRDKRLAPLVTQADHSVLNPSLAPLPMMGLGLEASTSVQAGSTRHLPEDQYLILAQTWEPAWPVWKETPSFQQINAKLIEGQGDLAYWCGLLSA